jgi:hypothetical protein
MVEAMVPVEQVRRTRRVTEAGARAIFARAVRRFAIAFSLQVEAAARAGFLGSLASDTATVGVAAITLLAQAPEVIVVPLAT